MSRNGDRPADAIHTAEIVSIGSELTTGETRDTNAGDLARDLSERGVVVQRLQALPDRLTAVQEVLAAATARSELVITTGGLGPTPDDLTREAIATVFGEEPTVDKALAAHLESLFARRGLTMPPLNLKQAWLIPSARALPNPHGSAPGWWVERGGGVLVALPGPPPEMWPMWRHEVLPRLEARGLGDGRIVRVLRVTGVGESQIVATLGEPLFRAENPEVATYSRADAVDVRITAVPSAGRPAAPAVEAVERAVIEAFGDRVFARGRDDWPAALGSALGGRTVALVEAGTAGALVSLLGGAPWLVHAEVLHEARLRELPGLARTARMEHAADVGLALRAAERHGDTIASAAVDASGLKPWRESRTVFLAGEQGRRRAALAACAILYAGLRERV